MRHRAAGGGRIALLSGVTIGTLMAAALFACAGGTSRSPGPQLVEHAPGEMPLAPGDAIQLTFSREPALNGVFAIDEKCEATVLSLMQGAMAEKIDQVGGTKKRSRKMIQMHVSKLLASGKYPVSGEGKIRQVAIG